MNTIFTVIILCHGFVQYTLPCTESRGTVEYVEYCPRNKSEWFQASRRKNCSSIKHSCGTLVYHCVINPFADVLLEVCAPRRNILDQMCAEYNNGGGLVQENQLVSCKNHTVKCEFGYSSDEAYKYQECYDLLISPSNRPRNAEQYSSTSDPGFRERCEEDHSSATALGVGLGVAITASIIQAVGFIFFRRKKNKQIACIRRLVTNRYKTTDVASEEEITHLNETDGDLKNPTGSDKSESGREKTPRKDDRKKDFENLTGSDKTESGKERKPGKDDKYQIVAAIDFGATYTGSAYSTTQTPFDINTSPFITGNRVATKTESAVLLDKGGKLLQFGSDATTKYYEKSLDDRKNFRYFDELYALTDNMAKMELQDKAGKAMEATAVLGKYLEGIMGLLRYKAEEKYVLKRILFVITIPNDWDESRKSVMIKAATSAGISKFQLKVISEADAIPCFLKDFNVFMKEGCICYRFDTREALVTDTMSYIVLDLGGKRADIVVLKDHEIDGDPHIEPWLEDSIAKRFSMFISKLVGKGGFQKIIETYHGDYIGMLREIEERITTATPTSTGISISVPSWMPDIVNEYTKGDMATVVSASRDEFKHGVSYTKGHLSIDPNVFPCYFIDNAIKKLKSKLTSLIEGDSPKIDIKKIKLVLMVGGYSNITLMQLAVRDFDVFKGKPILVPKNAELAVLQSAVLKGHSSLEPG